MIEPAALKVSNCPLCGNCYSKISQVIEEEIRLDDKGVPIRNVVSALGTGRTVAVILRIRLWIMLIGERVTINGIVF